MVRVQNQKLPEYAQAVITGCMIQADGVCQMQVITALLITTLQQAQDPDIPLIALTILLPEPRLLLMAILIVLHIITAHQAITAQLLPTTLPPRLPALYRVQAPDQPAQDNALLDFTGCLIVEDGVCQMVQLMYQAELLLLPVPHLQEAIIITITPLI